VCLTTEHDTSIPEAATHHQKPIELLFTTSHMSDTRNDAEQEMVNAGISDGLEDSLGVSDYMKVRIHHRLTYPVLVIWLIRPT